MGKLRLTADEFAERVKQAYNGRISIVKETYTGTRNKVTAYCNVHKIYFEVKEARSLTRCFAECPKCLKEKNDANRKKQIKEWKEVLKSFKEKYGEKFSYDETSYNGVKQKMKVHCNDCGEDFEITPVHHLKYNNGGCLICKEKQKIKYRNKHKNSKKLNKSEEEKKQYNRKRSQIYKASKMYICPCCGQKHKYKEKCQTSELCRKHPNRIWYKNLIPFGFDYSKLGTIEYITEYNKVIELLKYEYFENKLSAKQIYEKYNCQQYFKYETVIRNLLKSENFKTRNISESLSNAIETGRYVFGIRSIIFKTEYHTSWEGKTFLLRSSYETDFANILDEQQTPYEVEALRIRYFDTQQQKERIAIPDFLLTESNTIIEVKSSWTFDKQNMLDKRDAYIALGYEFKLWYEHEFVDLDTM